MYYYPYINMEYQRTGYTNAVNDDSTLLSISSRYWTICGTK
jgi:hypothetical protein